MEWEIEGTDEFAEWYGALHDASKKAVESAIIVLSTKGPALGRPFVGTVKGSRVSNMKELRPKLDNIRILFVFDPRRTAILLLGGSKTDDWHGWYARNIPEAERRYDAYLIELRKDGLL